MPVALCALSHSPLIGLNQPADEVVQAVDAAIDDAKHLAAGALATDIDLTVSARMKVDHGFAQPLEVLFGALDAVPVVPVFINSVATPFGPVRRIRRLGAALGAAVAELNRRVLFVGSGGLSHDPPVPVLEGARPRVAEALIAGTAPPRSNGRAVSIGFFRLAATTPPGPPPCSPSTLNGTIWSWTASRAAISQ